MHEPFFRTKQSASEGVIRAQAVMVTAGQHTDWVPVGTREFMVMVSPAVITAGKIPDTQNPGFDRPIVTRTPNAAFASSVAVQFKDVGDHDDEAFEIQRYTGKNVAIASRDVPAGGFVRLMLVDSVGGEVMYGEVRLSREDGNSK